MNKYKIIEIDAEYFDVPIKKGKTIVKVVLVKDVLKAKEELKEKFSKTMSIEILTFYCDIIDEVFNKHFGEIQ